MPMRFRFATTAVLLIPPLLCWVAPAAAQTRPEPRLVFSISGGIAGAGNLWSVDRQALSILGAEPTADTISLRRQLSTGLVAGLSTTFFKSTHLGITGQAVYIGLGTDSNCRFVFKASPIDREGRNQQVCNDITRQERTVSIAGFYLGATYRFAARGAISPYVRLLGGTTVRSSSLVETSGRFVAGGTEGERVIYLGKSSTTVNPSAVGGIGVMVPLAPGYLLRMELADHLIRMEQVTGPDLLANPPTANFFDHVPSFTVSIDIVLEQRRGRRF